MRCSGDPSQCTYYDTSIKKQENLQTKLLEQDFESLSYYVADCNVGQTELSLPSTIHSTAPIGIESSSNRAIHERLLFKIMCSV